MTANRFVRIGFLIIVWAAFSGACRKNTGLPTRAEPPGFGIPVPMRPAEGALVFHPTFEWSRVEGASAYRFQAGGDSGFVSAFMDTTIDSVSFDMGGPVPGGVGYWRVRGCGAEGRCGDWSAVSSFIAAVQVADSLVVPAGARPVRLSAGQLFSFLEGPAWDGMSSLYFSDIPNNRIHALSAGGTFSVFRSNSNASNGLMFDALGRLLACEGGTGRITALDSGGNVAEIMVSLYGGKRFNSPNDLVIDSDGGIYFTDPTWDANSPQKVNGVYYRSPGGTVTLLIDDMDKPNGILLSPDGRILYVDDSNSIHVRAYDVAQGGSLSNFRNLITLAVRKGARNAVADGMALDFEGRLYVTTDLGIQVFRPDGRPITTIAVPETPANCTFGGPDMKVLYITARTNLYSIRLNATGLRYPVR